MNPASPSASSPARPDAGELSWLSALADGQADAADPACRLWRDNPQARAQWHRYHLIGDVMRSEALAASPTRDAAFLSRLRARLSAEPLVLAPPPSAAAAHRWRLPAAVAAGFVLVAGVLLLARMGALAPGVELAGAARPPMLVLAAGAELQATGKGQALLTDPRLDEFLRAHQAAGRDLPLPPPGAPLRRVDLVVPLTAPR